MLVWICSELSSLGSHRHVFWPQRCTRCRCVLRMWACLQMSHWRHHIYYCGSETVIAHYTGNAHSSWYAHARSLLGFTGDKSGREYIPVFFDIGSDCKTIAGHFSWCHDDCAATESTELRTQCPNLFILRVISDCTIWFPEIATHYARLYVWDVPHESACRQTWQSMRNHQL